MKLVLDYIYGGAMYLCGAHMQYVIQVSTVPYNPVLRSWPFLNESGAEIWWRLRLQTRKVKWDKTEYLSVYQQYLISYGWTKMSGSWGSFVVHNKLNKVGQSSTLTFI